MNSRRVHECLMDVFPQVDSRILKAVSLEHPKDVEIAVDTVLTEVIPNVSHVPAMSSSKCIEGRKHLSNKDHADLQPICSSQYQHNVEMESAIDDSCQPSKENICSVSSNSSNCILNSSVHEKSSGSVDDSQIILRHPQEDKEFGNVHIPFTSATASGICPVGQEPDIDDASESGFGGITDAGASRPDSLVLLNDSNNNLAIKNSMIRLKLDAADGDPDLVSYYSQSSDVAKENPSIDLIERAVEDAQQSKKSLLSAVVSLRDLIKRVESQEKMAEEAKDAASSGGMDTSMKMAEANKTISCLKHANELLAANIFGEKAILATEAKELQLRIRGLISEKDQALSAVDEMCQSLEALLCSAEEQIKEAEKEKAEKENNASRNLEEQQVILQKLDEEAQILRHEAEENSKLREFLVDRGHAVDMLQGEISVICQDVSVLKKKLDERVPLGESVLSNRTRCNLSCSASSHGTISNTESEPGAVSVTSPDSLELSRRNRKEVSDGWDFLENDISC